MNDTIRAAVDRIETKVKEKIKKHKDGTGNSADPDPYCCTPPEGDGGPDTKP